MMPTADGFVKRRGLPTPGSIPDVLDMFRAGCGEDVSAAPGVLDLAWLLVSSVDPARWPEVIDAYGPAPGLGQVLPAVIVQGLLSLADTQADSAEAYGWIARLGQSALLVAAAS
jgi:hypothetical protein